MFVHFTAYFGRGNTHKNKYGIAIFFVIADTLPFLLLDDQYMTVTNVTLGFSTKTLVI